MSGIVATGNIVCYTAEFCRSIGAYTGKLPFARGRVTAIERYAGNLTLASVEWDTRGLPDKVNVWNLERIRR
jgi:hypothetical protein